MYWHELTLETSMNLLDVQQYIDLFLPFCRLLTGQRSCLTSLHTYGLSRRRNRNQSQFSSGVSPVFGAHVCTLQLLSFAGSKNRRSWVTCKMVAKLPLRCVQMGINSLTIVLGIIACIPQGTVTDFFESQCVLNAHLSLTRVNDTIKIIATDTEWGNVETCNFTTFTAVVGAIHAFIWCWFFLLMRGSLKADG